MSKHKLEVAYVEYAHDRQKVRVGTVKKNGGLYGNTRLPKQSSGRMARKNLAQWSKYKPAGSYPKSLDTQAWHSYGGRTVCGIAFKRGDHIAGKVYGVAYCSASDEYDPAYGEALAFKRAVALYSPGQDEAKLLIDFDEAANALEDNMGMRKDNQLWRHAKPHMKRKYLSRLREEEA